MTARSMPPRAQSRGEEGFTLIEVLVSLILLVLVVALLAGGLRFARSTWDAAARLDELAGASMAETFLRARLAEAMPIHEQRTAGTVGVLFQGTGDTLSFVAPAPNGPAGSGLYRYTLRVDAGAGPRRRTLVVGLVPYNGRQGAAGGEKAPQRHALIGNLRSVAFRYFGPGAVKAEPAWHNAWPRTDALPSLVEMTAVRDESDGGPISLVVALRLQANMR